MAVTREEILVALQGGKSAISTDDWHRIVGQYPYCEIFVWHYLRALYRSDDVTFDGELQRLAIHLSDKQAFYLFMTQREGAGTLFETNAVSTDYFAYTSTDTPSLSELARRLKAARLASFCKGDDQKNDIAEGCEEAEKEVLGEKEVLKTAEKAEEKVEKCTPSHSTESTNDVDSLRVIRAQIGALVREKKYSEALEILKRENFANSKKNAYFAVQIKYLETIINSK